MVTMINPRQINKHLWSCAFFFQNILGYLSVESHDAVTKKMHISFYVGSCDNGFHSDETLFISLFIINMPNHQIR
jgi:hypothetical protein